MKRYDYSKMLKFKRGQVWMVKEQENVSRAKVKANVEAICFSRPYVIVSSDDVCANDYIVQGYPLTHSIDRTDDGIVISIPESSAEKSMILMNQLTPIETKNIHHYMFTVSDKLMEKIDNITASRMAIATTNDRIKELTRTIKKLEKDLLDAQTSRFTKLKNLPKTEPINAYVGDAEETPKNTDVVKHMTDVMEYALSSEDSKNESSTSSGKKKYNKWTTKGMARFLKDVETIGKNEVALKYGLKPSSIASTKYSIKKKLSELGIHN